VPVWWPAPHHYRHFLAAARRHGTDQALSGTRRRHHLTVLDAESDNFDAALAWAVGQRDAESALAMVMALGWYWEASIRPADAVDWIDQALALPGAERHPAGRAYALGRKALSLRWLGRVAEQAAVAADAESVARALGEPQALAQTLIVCAFTASEAGRLDRARALAVEAAQWASAAGNDWELAKALRLKATTASTTGEMVERVEPAVALLEEVGNVIGVGQLLADANYFAFCMCDDHDASELAKRATPIVREFDTAAGWMFLRGDTGLVALLTGETDTARDAFREQLELCRQHVVLPVASEGLLGLAAVAVAGGQLGHAARLRGAAAAHAYEQQTDVEARLETAFFTAARTRHGADAWDAAVREGSALSFEAALACALEEPDR
jgi:tetratricopeptide (TPR) repeat protein